MAAVQAAAGKICKAGSKDPAFFKPLFYSSTVFMKRLITVLALLFLVTNAFSQKGIKAVIKQKPNRLVNDYVQALTATENRNLEKKLVDFNHRTSTQIAVVLVQSLGGLNIEDAAYKLFNTWGIGQKDKNNGLLILAAIQDRKLRIEVGKGLTDAITNEEAAHIIQEQIVPNFKEAKYYDGLDEATSSLMKLALQAFPDTTTGAAQGISTVEQQPITEPRPASYDYAQQNTYVSETNSGLTTGIRVAIFFVIAFFVLLIIAAIMRNRNSGSVYSGGGYRSYNSTGTGSSGRGIFGGLIGGLFGGYLLSQWFNSNRNDHNNNDNWNNNNGNFNAGDSGSGSSDFGGFGGGSSDGGAGSSDFSGGSDSGGGASGDW